MMVGVVTKFVVLSFFLTIVRCDGPDRGNWTVENCIMVSMAAQLELNTVKANPNQTLTVNIPVSAQVSSESSCNIKNTSQSMTLNWTDKNPDDPSDSLSRNFTLIFSMNNTTNVYGVSLIKGVYELKSRNETDPKTNSTVLVKDYVSFTTFNLQPWEFSVSKNRSYMCLDLGTKSMEAELHKSNENGGDPGEKLRNATFSATHVQFDAFRTENIPDGVYQVPSDCSYRPNDVVPIIVGCALAGMVVMVLVAYMVGRSRSRARGYMSV